MPQTQNEMIIAQLATIPERSSILERVVKSIIDQVDRLNIAMAMNLVDDDIIAAAHALPEFLINPKIMVTFHDNTLQDGAKFINAPTDQGHTVIVIDDDIEYPGNFVEMMMNYLAHPFNGRAILSVMGKKLSPKPVPNYFKSEIFCKKTFEEIREFWSVEIPGTCGMIYSTDRVVITPADMTSPNADLCVGAIAKARGIQCFVVPHEATWLLDMTPLLPAGSPNMFDRYKEDDSILTKFINANL